jgi:hypothetical protein
MNPLLNIIFMSVALYFILPHIDRFAPEPLYNKLLFVIITVGLQIIFGMIVKIVKKESLFEDIGKIVELSLSKSILLLLGLLLFKDVRNSPSIIQKFPMIGGIVAISGSELIFVMVPTLLMLTSKCLLKPY